MQSKYSAKRGFTLIEILVVIGIIAILATIVIVAINPARQFAQANNTTRTSNINTILNAIGQKMADNKGVFATGGCPALPVAPAAAQTIYADNTGPVGTSIDLSCLAPTYVTALPIDPTAGAGVNTAYTVVVDANGRVTVAAPSTQVPPAAAVISVTR